MNKKNLDSVDKNAEKEKNPFWLSRSEIRWFKNYLPNVQKFILSKGINAVMKAHLITVLMKEWKWMLYFKYLKEINNGLRSWSIIWNPLYYPWWDWKLEFKPASAWLWNAYDFRRNHLVESTKYKTSQLVTQWKIIFFPLDDDIVSPESHWSDTTPDDYFNFFLFDHFIHLTSATISDLIEYWAVRETNYESALIVLGQDDYLQDAENLWILDKKVFQITPKWNGLIQLDQWWWDKSNPQKDLESQSELDLGWIQPA